MARRNGAKPSSVHSKERDTGDLIFLTSKPFLARGHIRPRAPNLGSVPTLRNIPHVATHTATPPPPRAPTVFPLLPATVRPKHLGSLQSDSRKITRSGADCAGREGRVFLSSVQAGELWDVEFWVSSWNGLAGRSLRVRSCQDASSVWRVYALRTPFHLPL